MGRPREDLSDIPNTVCDGCGATKFPFYQGFDEKRQREVWLCETCHNGKPKPKRVKEYRESAKTLFDFE